MTTSFEQAIAGFEVHLDAGRGYSANTVKAYLIDVQDLVDFLKKQSVENIDDLNLEHLRDWLWQASEAGITKATIARKSSAIRAFTAWALKTGLTTTDPKPSELFRK